MQKKTMRQGGVGLMALGVLGVAASGCLTREVSTGTPTTKLSVTAAQDNRKVNKIDLLFAIDDSSSMGDKQKFLKESVPILLTRLVSPNCINEQGAVTGSSPCAAGSKPEFDAITDIHVGVVTSSLGTAGDICKDNGTEPPTRNRHAELFAPTTPAASAPATEPSKFLAWYPDVTRDFPSSAPTKPYKTTNTLISAFQSFFTELASGDTTGTSGIGQNGCGIEAQLESVYQFLVQPDPFNAYGSGSPVRQGIRENILKQRKDFLRPDSLVAVIMLTDENDASIDPEVFGGGGSRFSSFDFGAVGSVPASTKLKDAPYSGINSTRGTSFPKGTAACANLKNASAAVIEACTTCAVKPTSPECADPYLAPEDDSLNTRYARMKQRYGLDPLFPISRYVRGFSSTTVPKRDEEHSANGTYQPQAGTCVNPLFAASLPASSAEELCALEKGVRTSDLVYFAVIGGVPQDLLREGGKPKPYLSENDWVKILGKNPDKYDFDGIDPRMYELGTPRIAAALAAQNVAANPAGIDEVRAAVNAGKTAAANPDFVIADRNTNVLGKEGSFGADLNYACTFPIAPRALTANDVNGPGECNKYYDNEACNPAGKSADTANRNQIRAKAYPTTRELQVARALGTRGIAASLCPIKITSANPNEDADYGYNPAVKAIVDRLADAINSRCLSQPLEPTSAEGEPVSVDCAMYEIVKEGTASQDGECASRPNREVPDATRVARFRDALKAEGSAEQAAMQICVLKQTPVNSGETCLNATEPGWCYVQTSGTKKPAGEKCSQAIVFQKDTLLTGSQVRLQCVSKL